MRSAFKFFLVIFYREIMDVRLLCANRAYNFFIINLIVEKTRLVKAGFFLCCEKNIIAVFRLEPMVHPQ
jgi:hypothetical protein